MDGARVAEAISVSPELSPERLAQLTARFVSVPSVNGEHSERDLALVISEELQKSGYETTMVGLDSRPSLGAKTPAEPRILLNGHLDTVPVDDAADWRFDPFAGVIEAGAVHGRGACDMKGGLAIQVAVAQWLAELGRADGVVLHFAMGEERGEPGTEELLAAGFTAPLGVVLEPTDFQLGIAQRGLMTLRVSIAGRAGHASRPELTDNPIGRLESLLAAVTALHSNPTSSHPRLGAPTWTPTMIHAGVIPSMVPGSCEIHVDHRMIPGETVDDALATLSQSLSEVEPDAEITVEVAEEEGIYHPAEVAQHSPVVVGMCEALEANGEEARLYGTPYSSDVRHLINTAGIEAVTFGPGRASEMHARDEFIEVDHLARAARIVAFFALRALDVS